MSTDDKMGRMYHLALTTGTEPELRDAYLKAITGAVTSEQNLLSVYDGVEKQKAMETARQKPWFWALPGCVMWSDDATTGPGGEDTGLLDRAHAEAYYEWARGQRLERWAT